VEALGDVFAGGYYVDKVIERRFKAHPKWGSRDRRQFAETVYEITRWWRWHWHLAGLPDAECTQRDLITYERVWDVWTAFWISKTGKQPHFDECREVTPKDVAERSETRVPAAVRAAVPDWLNDLGKQELGEAWPPLLRALNRPADVFLRTNTLKIETKPLLINLEKEGIQAELVPDLPTGLKLAKRQSIFQTTAFKAGLFEVQDAASQAVAPLLHVSPGQRVIDACAGAGGKALHLACLMKNKGKIIALDVHQWKLDELRKRARRNQVDIIESRVIDDAKVIKRLQGTADRLLLDVPCSGLGVIRRNPDTKWKLSLEELNRLRALQAQLLSDYSRMVKPGGKLLYATCSVLPSENEEQVRAFLKAHPQWELEEELHARPDKRNEDGFYAARLALKGSVKEVITASPSP
jgi:16S rRNA (cytosine967-C5)-methyltransferase